MPRQRNNPRRSYVAVLHALRKSQIPFMVGGAFAMLEHGDIVRDTKDLDIFCTPRDYPAILHLLSELGYKLEISDPDWLAKGFTKDVLIDVIFGSGNRLHKVNYRMIDRAHTSHVLGVEVKILSPEEMILFKLYVQERDRFDGADINHIIKKKGTTIDWRYLLEVLDSDWELLFGQVLNFRFVYPSERNIIPEWVLREFINRLDRQLVVPVPKDRICRGPLLAYTQYRPDTLQWGYRT